MVAAGGGGAYYSGYGGYGGTLTGGAGEGYDSNYSNRAGVGGTQQSYRFGYVTRGGVCSPGNGYYSGEELEGANAGGGSSFISGYPGCKAIDENSTENNIISLDTPNHYSGKVFTDFEMIDGNSQMPTHDGLSTMTGNTGNGFAKITYKGAS